MPQEAIRTGLLSAFEAPLLPENLVGGGVPLEGSVLGT